MPAGIPADIEYFFRRIIMGEEVHSIVERDMLEGIHFYINIKNYNDIIVDDEKSNGRVNHSIHALNTFFSRIESYGNKCFKDSFVVEKITGSRLHMYVKGAVNSSFEVVKYISSFAYSLSKLINHRITKYNKLKDFQINIGVAFGSFFVFEFVDQGYSEITTIGYAANIAAKIQNLTECGMMGITEDVYNSLSSEEQSHYKCVSGDCIKNYEHDYYVTSIDALMRPDQTLDEYLEESIAYANERNLSDIEFVPTRNIIDFSSLGVTRIRDLQAIPLFADVRGFTGKFYEDNSNLIEMVSETKRLLSTMYHICTDHGGVHVQFQGDREFALFHNIPRHTVNGIEQPEKKCFKTAVLAAMRMIDIAGTDSIHIGVGADFGRVFATKIGARGERDNIVIGETVIEAETMEDAHAGKNQIAVTKEVYEGLSSEDTNLASFFENYGDYYTATIGYSEYQKRVSYNQHSTRTTNRNYNGLWRRNDGA